APNHPGDRRRDDLEPRALVHDRLAQGREQSRVAALADHDAELAAAKRARPIVDDAQRWRRRQLDARALGWSRGLGHVDEAEPLGDAPGQLGLVDVAQVADDAPTNREGLDLAQFKGVRRDDVTALDLGLADVE